MAYITTGTYYFGNTDRPPVAGMSVVPVVLNDIGVDDTTTGPTEASDNDSFTGDPCGISLDIDAIQTVAWKAASLTAITAIRITGRCRLPTTGFLTECIGEPGETTLTSERVIEYTADEAGLSGWTELQTNSMPLSVFSVVTWNGAVEIWWLRSVLRSRRQTLNQGNGPGGSFSAFAQSTDWRIEGTAVNPPTPTPTPTPDPDGPGGGDGQPGGDNGWTVTPLPTTEPWDRVCGEGESGWTRSNVR